MAPKHSASQNLDYSAVYGYYLMADKNHLGIPTQPSLPAHEVVTVGASSFKPGTASGGLYQYQWGLNLTISGQAHWQFPASSCVTHGGDLLLGPPPTGSYWQVGGSEPWVTVYAAFRARPHWHEWLSQFEITDGRMVVSLAGEPLFEQVHAALQRAAHAYLHSTNNRLDWAMLAIEEVLLALHSHRTLRRAVPDARVEAAVRFIHAHFPEPLTMHRVARAVYLSESRLSLLFSRQMGMAPMAYLENVRLTRAGEMLRFGATAVAEVAAAVGYTDPNYFSRRFTLFTGQSPRQFRRASQHGVGIESDRDE